MSGRARFESGRTGNRASGSPPQACGALPRWRFVALVRLGNHALLRRHLGRARARRLVADLSLWVEHLLPGSRVAVGGADLLEIAFEDEARDAVDRALAKLDGLFTDAVEIDGESHDVELLFGAAVSDGPPADEVGMIERAEQALAQAGPDRKAVVVDVNEPALGVDRIALAHDLSRAVERGELFLQYQPKIHLRRNAVTGAEALIRWRHPTRGLVLPGDFIPLAEETRAIGALTLWTIGQALADQEALAAAGHPMRVFVNISGVLLGDVEFARRARALVRGGADRIGFEVTETSVIRDPEAAITNLQAFADLGVEIAIDDYGAGLSSLAYLKRLPASELKIDKLFVTQLTNSNRDPLIVRSTIDLAHALDMAVVAEGVEEQAALALLGVMGCDMAQGYLISRPVGLAALIAWLDAGDHAHMLEDSRATFGQLAATWKRAR